MASKELQTTTAAKLQGTFCNHTQCSNTEFQSFFLNRWTLNSQHTKSALGFEDMVVQQVITIVLWTSTVTEGASILRRRPIKVDRRRVYFLRFSDVLNAVATMTNHSSNSTAHWFCHDKIVVGCDRVATQNSYVCIKIGKLFLKLPDVV